MFNPWVGMIPWKKKRQLTPIFSPEKVPWTEEPGRLQSMGVQRVRHDLATKQQVSKCYQILGFKKTSAGLDGFLTNQLNELMCCIKIVTVTGC